MALSQPPPLRSYKKFIIFVVDDTSLGWFKSSLSIWELRSHYEKLTMYGFFSPIASESYTKDKICCGEISEIIKHECCDNRNDRFYLVTKAYKM